MFSHCVIIDDLLIGSLVDSKVLAVEDGQQAMAAQLWSLPSMMAMPQQALMVDTPEAANLHGA